MNTSKTGYYLDQAMVPLLATYVYFPFNFAAQYMTIVNDDTMGSNQVIISFNGTTKHGQINATESYTFDFIDAGGVYLKYVNGAPSYRVMARPE